MNDFIVPGTNGMSRFWRLNASGTDEIGGNTLSVSNTTYKKTPRGYQTYCATANGSSSSLTSGATVSGVRTLFFSIYPTSNNRTFLTATGISVTINSSSQIATSGLTGVSVTVNGQPTTSIVLNAWNFVTLTHDSANYASVNIFVSSFIGDAQEVGTFDRVISETEIRNWYLESLRALGGSTLSGLMDGVVAYYDFRGDANDIVGGFDGTIGSATTVLSPKGFSFNATNDARVLIPNNSLTSPVNNYSIILYASPATTGQFCFGWDNNGIEFTLTNIGITRYVGSNIPYNASISASASNKYCIVLTQSSTTGLKIYYEGVLAVNQPTLTNNTLDSALSTAIGGRADGASPSNAKIYDAIMLNREVTATEAIAWTGILKQDNVLPFA